MARKKKQTINVKETEYYRYAQDVIDGKIVAGELAKLACKRFMSDLERPDLEFRAEIVDRFITFCSLIKHFKGKSANEKFILENWQQFIAANIIGFYYKNTDDRKYTNSLICVSRKQGKALSLDTPIPTPDGWKTMGDLQVGDFVWGADGKPTRVTFVTETMYNHKCYKVTFSDGETVVADAEHNWFVKVWHHSTKVMTTEEIFKSKWKHIRNDKKGVEYIYRIPVNKPIQNDDIDLPVDPYTLGCWLADGNRRDPIMTTADFDLQMYDRISKIYGEPKLRHDKRTKAIEVIYTGDGHKIVSKLRQALIKAGVLNNKHVPSIYMFASERQRLELLQGFMDSDGYISNQCGQCEFQQKSVAITDGICEILSTLGITYTRTTRIPTINGKKCNEVQRVSFFTDKKLPCFTLQRKYERLKDALNKRMEYKSIVNIEETESVPVKCITVDNEDHLYLFGKRYSVTHNTALAALFCLWFLIGDGESGAEVDLAANSRQQAQIAYEFCTNYAKQLDPSGKELKCLRTGIKLKLNDSNLNVFAADSTKLDGFNASFALIDEYHAAKDSRLYDVLKSSQGQRKNPHLMVISTVGFSITSPFKKLYDTDCEILHGLKKDDSTFAMIFALDDGDDWRDETVWRKIAPNLDITVTTKYLREQVIQAENNVSAETGILVKNFNVWQQVTNIWIPDSYVNRCFKKISYSDFNEDTSLCYVGTDLASVGDMTAVSCLFTRDGDDKLYFITEYFLPETALTESPNRELYKQWKRQGLLTITEGNVTDYVYVTKMLIKRNSHIPIRKIAYDSWNSVQWATDSTEVGLPLEPFSQSIGNFNRPTRELERLIRSQKVVFQTNEITRWMFRNVLLKHDHNDNVKPTKGGTGNQKIDGVIAILEALGIYLLEPRYSGEIFTV